MGSAILTSRCSLQAIVDLVFKVRQAGTGSGCRASRTFGERYRLIHASVATFAGDRGMPTHHDRRCVLCRDSVLYWAVV